MMDLREECLFLFHDLHGIRKKTNRRWIYYTTIFSGIEELYNLFLNLHQSILVKITPFHPDLVWALGRLRNTLQRLALESKKFPKGHLLSFLRSIVVKQQEIEVGPIISLIQSCRITLDATTQLMTESL